MPPYAQRNHIVMVLHPGVFILHTMHLNDWVELRKVYARWIVVYEAPNCDGRVVGVGM